MSFPRIRDRIQMLLLKRFMTTSDPLPDGGKNNRALDDWENEGGAPADCSEAIDYGRRIESDRTWTLYHVFTGTPVVIDGIPMTGMSAAASLERIMKSKAEKLALQLKASLPARTKVGLWLKRRIEAWR